MMYETVCQKGLFNQFFITLNLLFACLFIFM